MDYVLYRHAYRYEGRRIVSAHAAIVGGVILVIIGIEVFAKDVLL